MFVPKRRYKVLNGLKRNTGGLETTYTGLFDLLGAYTEAFSGYDFWSDLTVALLDPYLNHFLKDCLLVDDISGQIKYDNNTGIYTIDADFDLEALAYALAAKFTETEATFKVMSQQNLNIVQYIDIDQNVYGARSATRNYGKVTLDITNGQRTLTDTIAQRSNTLGGGTDTTTQAVQGFNSSSWSDSDKSTTVEAQRTNTVGGGIDTHVEAQSTDKQETAAREDGESFTSYTDTLTHTKHLVLSPDAYFEIQKEMADYNLYVSVRDAVMDTVTKGVW